MHVCLKHAGMKEEGQMSQSCVSALSWRHGIWKELESQLI